MKSSNGKFQSARNNGLTIKHKPKKKKNTKVIDKELQIKNIIQSLNNGDTAPAKNYLRSLLKKESLITKTSSKVSNEFRLENLSKMTSSEKYAYKIMKNHNIVFAAQKVIHYDIGKFYILDFYVPSIKSAIEIDGGYHLDEERIIADKLRDANILAKGIKTVRFTNEDVSSGVFEKYIETIKNA